MREDQTRTTVNQDTLTMKLFTNTRVILKNFNKLNVKLELRALELKPIFKTEFLLKVLVISETFKK